MLWEDLARYTDSTYMYADWVKTMPLPVIGEIIADDLGGNYMAELVVWFTADI
jgi:hypothetical protein